MTRWNPDPHELGTWAEIRQHDDEWFSFDISADSGTSIHLVGSGQGEDAGIRAVCMAMLAFMPPEGLEETCETLIDVYQFHTSPPERVLPPPSVINVAALATSAE